MYAIIKIGYAMFGRGKTKKEAIEEATNCFYNPKTGSQGGLTIGYVEEMLYHGDRPSYGDIIITDDEELIAEYKDSF